MLGRYSVADSRGRSRYSLTMRERLLVSMGLLASMMACGDDGMPSDAAIDATAATVDGAVGVDAAAGSDAAGADAAVGVRSLDPASVIFYDLPINSLRYAVSGLEPQSGLCVTLVWYVSEPSSDGSYQFCGLAPDPPGLQPYALVAPMTAPDPWMSGDPIYGSRPCEVWDYGPHATVQALDGCARFNDLPVSSGQADLVVTLDSPLLSGQVAIRSP